MKKVLLAGLMAFCAMFANAQEGETAATTSTIGGIATSTVVTGAIVVGVAAAIIANADDDGSPVIECPIGQFLQGGVCVDITCDPGEELVNGVCQPIICADGETLVDGVCVPDPLECPIGEQPNEDGTACVPIVCADNETLVGNDCIPNPITSSTTIPTGPTQPVTTTTR